MLGWALETALALMLSLMVLWLWPRLSLPRLGQEQVWFSLGWFIALAVPAAARALWPQPTYDPAHQLLRAGTCSAGSLLLGFLFVILLLGGAGLGNYKLWLGLTYLGGITLSLASLTLRLKSHLASRPRRSLLTALVAAGISSAACLLILPWVRPDLAAQWPPPAAALAAPLLAALLWGGVSGLTLLVMRLLADRRRMAWFVYLAVGLGPGPALAVSWFPLLPMALALLILAGLASLNLLRRQERRAQPDPEQVPPLAFYWLLRTLMLAWWGVGAAVTLAVAWWYPRVDAMFTSVDWLRAVGLGVFLVICGGVLAEYSLPLMGRSRVFDLGPDQKVAGVFCSCLALLAMLAPFLLLGPPSNPRLPKMFSERSRAVLLEEPVPLGPNNPEIELRTPTWLSGLTRIFVVSLLDNAAQVQQGQSVAQLIATDDQGLPHIFLLRAGIDSAEWDLQRRSMATLAQHRPARLASTWLVYTAKGEAFRGHDYYSGLYLGRTIDRLQSVRLRYIYRNPPGRPPVTLVLKRVFVY
ncbi:MAG: hypothetical protein AB1814_17050 [Thermodesulfobacteriota bacterium]